MTVRKLHPRHFSLRKWFFNVSHVLVTKEKDVGFECGFSVHFLLIFIINTSSK